MDASNNQTGRRATHLDRQVDKFITARDKLRMKLKELEEADDYLDLPEKRMIRHIERMDKIAAKIAEIEVWLSNHLEDSILEQLVPKFPTITIHDTGLQPLNDLITEFINRPVEEKSIRPWDHYTRLTWNDVKEMLKNPSVLECPKTKDIIPLDLNQRDKIIIDIIENTNKRINMECNKMALEDIDFRYETDKPPPEGHPPELEDRDVDRIRIDFERVKKELDDLPIDENLSLDNMDGIDLSEEGDTELGDEDEIESIEFIDGSSTSANKSDEDSHDELEILEVKNASNADLNEDDETIHAGEPPLKKPKQNYEKTITTPLQNDDHCILRRDEHQLCTSMECNPLKITAAEPEISHSEEIILSSDEDENPLSNVHNTSNDSDIVCLD